MQHGATEEQIAEAVMVAAEMGGGPVLARCGFAFKVVEYLKGQKK
jgi:alkylhydroperoxidase/carboxymuconolactone decarboxylase family protein YurZ